MCSESIRNKKILLSASVFLKETPQEMFFCFHF